MHSNIFILSNSPTAEIELSEDEVYDHISNNHLLAVDYVDENCGPTEDKWESILGRSGILAVEGNKITLKRDIEDVFQEFRERVSAQAFDTSINVLWFKYKMDNVLWDAIDIGYENFFIICNESRFCDCGTSTALLEVFASNDKGTPLYIRQTFDYHW